MDTLRQLLPFLIPIILLQLALIVLCLLDLSRRAPKEVNGPKWVWAILIIVINFLGPLAYFLIGRREA